MCVLSYKKQTWNISSCEQSERGAVVRVLMLNHLCPFLPNLLLLASFSLLTRQHKDAVNLNEKHFTATRWNTSKISELFSELLQTVLHVFMNLCVSARGSLVAALSSASALCLCRASICSVSAEASLTGSLFSAPSGGPRWRYLNFDTSAGMALLLPPLGIVLFPRSCESTVRTAAPVPLLALQCGRSCVFSVWDARWIVLQCHEVKIQSSLDPSPLFPGVSSPLVYSPSSYNARPWLPFRKHLHNLHLSHPELLHLSLIILCLTVSSLCLVPSCQVELCQVLPTSEITSKFWFVFWLFESFSWFSGLIDEPRSGWFLVWSKDFCW